MHNKRRIKTPQSKERFPFKIKVLLDNSARNTDVTSRTRGRVFSKYTIHEALLYFTHK